MKKNIGFIILVFLLVVIAGFLTYIVVSKQNLSKQEFNIKRWDVIGFEDKDIEVRVLNIASTLCEGKDCIDEGEIEVAMEIIHNDEKANYTLKTVSKPNARILNSNYYVVLGYTDGDIIIDIKDKTEL